MAMPEGADGSAVVAVAPEEVQPAADDGQRGSESTPLSPDKAAAAVNPISIPVTKAPGYVGKNILIFSTRGNHHDVHLFPGKCIVGPDWPCMSYTWLLVIVPNLLNFVYIAIDWGFIFQLLAIVFWAFSVVSLALTAWSDPGFVVKQTKEWAEAQQALGKRGAYCREFGVFAHVQCVENLTIPLAVSDICNVPRKRGMLHCHECDICVEELDHHCPWMGKCIGKYNLRYFYWFLGAITLNIVYVVGGVFVYLGQQSQSSL